MPLKNNQPTVDLSSLVEQSISISSELYVSDILSAFEMAHSFPRRLKRSVRQVCNEMFDAWSILKVRQE